MKLAPILSAGLALLMAACGADVGEGAKGDSYSASVKHADEDGLCNDVTKPVDRTRKRRVLSQSEMRPDMVVIGSISLENLTQMGLAKDDDVIQAFSTDRANQPLGMPILPG